MYRPVVEENAAVVVRSVKCLLIGLPVFQTHGHNADNGIFHQVNKRHAVVFLKGNIGGLVVSADCNKFGFNILCQGGVGAKHPEAFQFIKCLQGVECIKVQRFHIGLCS